MATMDRSQIKLELKKWEKFFEKVNGRKPNRADVRAAGDDIKSLYKRYFDPSNQVWNASLLKKPKSSIDRRKSQACEPYLEKLRRNYTNMQFVKRTIMRRKKKKEDEPEAIVDGDEATIDPAGSILSQLTILTEFNEHSPEEQLSPTITGLTSSLITPSFSYPPELTVDSSAHEITGTTLLYSPNPGSDGEALMPTVVSNNDDILPSDPVAVITVSLDVNNGLLDVQSDSGIVSNGSVLSINSNDTVINSSSQFEMNSAIDADLFAGDFDTDPLVLQVKEAIDEKVDELEEEDRFEGCLLPLNYKRKPKPKVPTAKAIKKRNEENYIRIDLKKKSYASRGYKKLNVQKYKRKKYYNAMRAKRN